MRSLDGALYLDLSEAHRPAMRTALTSLLDPLVETGRCEFVGDVANPYSLRVASQVLGVALEDLVEVAAWVGAISRARSRQRAEHRQDAEWGFLQLEGYLRRLVDQRRQDPRGDLVSALVTAEDDGDRLSEAEIETLVQDLLITGYETTRHQLSLAMASFAQHADRWDLLAERPDLVPRAVEEVLRVHSTSSVGPRMAARDLAVDCGSPHGCLGADLGRAGLQEALTLLPAKMPGLALDGPITWGPSPGLPGPEALPLRFRPPVVDDGAGARRQLRRLPIAVRGRIVLVDVDHIDYLRAEGSYVRVHVGERSYLVRDSLTAMEARLDPAEFQRIHRSVIVRLDRICEIETLRHGEMALQLRDGTRLVSSRSYRQQLRDVLALPPRSPPRGRDGLRRC